MADEFPRWIYYPTHDPPPTWAREFVQVVAGARAHIDSTVVRGQNSDGVLARLRPGLERLGYQVERGKKAEEKVTRPVLFGDSGKERLTYEVDAFHLGDGIVVEVEAGRGAMNNAVYRDIIRGSLIVQARFLVIGVMVEYHVRSNGKDTITHSYRNARDQFDAIYASGRLHLPFEGVLLFGY